MSDRFLQEIMQWDREFRNLLEAWLAKVGVEPYSAPVATEPVATAPVSTAPVATAYHVNRDCGQCEESSSTSRAKIAAPVAAPASKDWSYYACSDPNCERYEMRSCLCESTCRICGKPTGNKNSGF